MFVFSVIVIGLKKCAALLPNYWLAEPPQPLFDVAWQTVGGKGADSEINCNCFLIKLQSLLQAVIFIKTL
ncbi:hypothetical protein [Peribacillus frigoritolerans]|uniref:hypothetical protein n=1 Tax=Peribacillus frigoritolerans TaxID=450367 RepID=UPI00382D2770